MDPTTHIFLWTSWFFWINCYLKTSRKLVLFSCPYYLSKETRFLDFEGLRNYLCLCSTLDFLKKATNRLVHDKGNVRHHICQFPKVGTDPPVRYQRWISKVLFLLLLLLLSLTKVLFLYHYKKEITQVFIL